MAKKEDFLKLEDDKNILEITKVIKSSLDQLEMKKREYPGDKEMLEFITQHYGLLTKYITEYVERKKDLSLFYPNKGADVLEKNKSKVAWFISLLKKSGSINRG
ncbi:MAG: hypothetical protein P9L89_05865 [Candidatus Celaenobacter polaris]|nr:hypothetical protein [Candidatus Celaenobacter polaris]